MHIVWLCKPAMAKPEALVCTADSLSRTLLKLMLYNASFSLGVKSEAPRRQCMAKPPNRVNMMVMQVDVGDRCAVEAAAVGKRTGQLSIPSPVIPEGPAACLSGVTPES